MNSEVYDSAFHSNRDLLLTVLGAPSFWAAGKHTISGLRSITGRRVPGAAVTVVNTDTSLKPHGPQMRGFVARHGVPSWPAEARRDRQRQLRTADYRRVDHSGASAEQLSVNKTHTRLDRTNGQARMTVFSNGDQYKVSDVLDLF